MKPDIRCYARPSRQHPGCYIGAFEVREKGRYLWTGNSGIARLTAADALADAERDARDVKDIATRKPDVVRAGGPTK